MDHGIAAGERRAQRFRVGEIADVRFAADAFEVGEIAGLADQQAQISAFGGQRFGHMMADKSGRACEEDFHGKCSSITFTKTQTADKHWLKLCFRGAIAIIATDTCYSYA